ncbi:hypothetical protein H0262_08220|nr:hypothetical protein [Psychrobacter sp. D2]MBA2057866.1 hypothetical protein [Psychrobacter sp. D2]
MLTPEKLGNTAGQDFIEQAFFGNNWTKNRYDITRLFLAMKKRLIMAVK